MRTLTEIQLKTHIRPAPDKLKVNALDVLADDCKVHVAELARLVVISYPDRTLEIPFENVAAFVYSGQDTERWENTTSAAGELPRLEQPTGPLAGQQDPGPPEPQVIEDRSPAADPEPRTHPKRGRRKARK